VECGGGDRYEFHDATGEPDEKPEGPKLKHFRGQKEIDISTDG